MSPDLTTPHSPSCWHTIFSFDASNAISFFLFQSLDLSLRDTSNTGRSASFRDGMGSQPCLQFSQQISIRSASSVCQCCEVRLTSISQHTWRQLMATCLPIYSFVHRSGQSLLRTNEPFHQRTTASAWIFLSSHVTLYIRCSCSFLFNDGVPPKSLSFFGSLPTVLRLPSMISGEPQHSKVSSSYVISWNLFYVS